MTKRAAVTKAKVNRIIKAELDAGLRVTSVMVKPDGTIITYHAGENPLAPIDGGSDGVTELDRWLSKEGRG